MEKMGLDMQEVDNVQEVVIKTDKKEIMMSKPQVTELKTKEGTVFTVSADSYEECELETPVFPDDDIDLVCAQAGVDAEKARAALAECDGAIARAIILLKGE